MQYHVRMQKRTREIAAVILLAMLGIGVAFAMGWYILVGHNWNVTASNIDDSIGHMDGYTIFLFKGTNVPDSPSKPEPNEEQHAQSDSLQAWSDDYRRNASNSSDALEEHSGDSALDELSRSYQDKGAIVYVLDTDEISRYAEPIVVAKNGKRVGLFSIGEPARSAAARVDVKLLARQQCDFIVMLTDDPNLADTPIKGVNLMISTRCDDRPTSGYYSESSFCVDAPYQGEIQAVIVSPSGVVSSKMLEQA